MSRSETDEPSTEGFIYELCKFTRQIRLLFILSMAMFGLMIIWFFFVRLKATEVIVTINLVFSGVMATLTGYALRRCLQRQQRRQEAYRRDLESD